jgi:Uma2 family endonuclease
MAAADVATRDATAVVARRRFTVDDYYRMAAAGVLDEDERVELIEGDIIEMSPIGVRHADRVRVIKELIEDQLGRSVIVDTHNPVRIDDLSEPQPDISVLVRQSYARRHPGVADVLLLIEVADTTIAYDRDVKAPLYARHGVPELWIIDIDHDVVLRFSEPAVSGYMRQERLARGATLQARLANTFDLTFSVTDLLPPVEDETGAEE